MKRRSGSTLSVRPFVNSVLETPRWALSFHRRHVLAITALGLVAASERFFSRLFEDLPRLPLEALTMASRLALVAYVIHLALRKDPAVAFGRGEGSVPKRHPTTARAFLPYLAGQGVLLCAAMFVFDFLPEQVFARYVPAAHHPLYFGCLLALKNVTVIPFTLIWATGMARRQLLIAEPVLATPAAPARA
ncbi:hypothetical protein GCM10010329_31480 [Streptomyces spiroverticillatus]|uniref:Uncharacterized protein n=1 Tax=Streptomyces finlayi TaxID=67296 RepID=A0A919C985_9ACTN|nr:hypothetical protein [Streptomyces finlayi]GHA06612.1 hypothetical protein GCM10010329_31480 [Streptomyces spiroverticillatus]GHC90124.1 hypothetical protein GCM10010334_23890 [Streptomyces finlayi]